MTQKIIDFGSFPDDPTADAIRTAFQKVQDNFTEVYSGVSSGGVTSINNTPGAGITVNSPTGNVVITANIACLQVHTNTLSIGRDANGEQDTVITNSLQTLWIDLPEDITQVNNIEIYGNLIAEEITANSVIYGYDLEISNTSILGNLATANFFQGDGGLLTNVSVDANSIHSITYGNSNVSVEANSNINMSVSGNANVMVVTGTGANLNGTLSVSGEANLGNVVTNGDVTSAGNVTGANIIAISDILSLGNVTAANFIGELSNGISNISIPIVNEDINFSVAGNANVFVVKSIGANVNGILSVAGNLISANANLGNLARANFIQGTLTTAVQPNITSLGILTLLSVSGNVNAGNVNGGNTVTANYFVGDGALLSNVSATQILNGTSNVRIPSINGNATISVNGTANVVVVSQTSANITGNLSVSGNITAGNTAGGNLVSANFLSGTLTTSSQPNITSVGSLSSLSVTGNITAGNIAGGNLVSANFLSGTLTTSSQPNITSVGTLTALSVNGNVTANYFIGDGSLLTNLPSQTNNKISNGTSNVQIATAGDNITMTVNGTANVVVVSQTSANITGNLSVSGDTAGGNLVSANFLSGTLTTSAQPNITSTGTLSSLSVTGNITAGNTAGGNLVSANYFSGNGSNLTNINASNITSGTIATARLATGTANNQTYLRGDQTWATVTAGISLTDDTSTNGTYYVPITAANSGTITSANVSSTKLYFNPSTGQLNATEFNSLSDELSKKDIETIHDAINLVTELRGVTFKWVENNKPSMGVIAQEVEKIIPEIVSTSDTGQKSVSYGSLIGLLIQAIKEQTIIINRHDQIINKIVKFLNLE